MIENATDVQNSTQAAQIKDLDQQIADKKARLGRAATCNRCGAGMRSVYFVHFVYFVHMWKTDKFTAYPHETKAPVYFVHFSPKYFARGARTLPNDQPGGFAALKMLV